MKIRKKAMLARVENAIRNLEKYSGYYIPGYLNLLETLKKRASKLKKEVK